MCTSTWWPQETVDDEVIRLEAMGATLRNWAEEEGTVWAVMLDPEGNEFCVMPPGRTCNRWRRSEQADGAAVLVDVDAAGTLGVLPRPGMRCMSPQSTTTNPAPALGTTPRTGSRKPVGRFSMSGSWLSERWVFAMQTGTWPKPSSSMRAMSFSACGR